jgi:hypothetical protein
MGLPANAAKLTSGCTSTRRRWRTGVTSWSTSSTLDKIPNAWRDIAFPDRARQRVTASS